MDGTCTVQNDETVDCSANGDVDCEVGNGGPGGPCGFAGFRDWCIPNVKKLQSIVDYSTCSGCNGGTSTSSVPGLTAAAIYWSATANASSTNFAWFVTFSNGGVLAPSVPARDWSFDKWGWGLCHLVKVYPKVSFPHDSRFIFRIFTRHAH